MPAGRGGGQTGTQSALGSGHRRAAEQGWPVHWWRIVSKHRPVSHGPFAPLHTPAARRSQSFAYVLPSHPQTGATRSKQTAGRARHAPPVRLQVPGRQSQNSFTWQSASLLQVRQTGVASEAVRSGHGSEAARWMTILLQARRSVPA